jgi:uncharacterized protein involved in response to NO
MESVRRDDVKPLPPSTRTMPDPYRVLFPIGIAAAFVALLPWVAQALSGAPWWPAALRPAWPGPAHAAIMMQGFELAFVCGFLLTAMPAFTHGARATRVELGVVTAGVAAFTVLRALEVAGAAIATLVTLLALGFAIARRVRGGAAAPPEEFLLVGTGLALGVAGALVETASVFGLMPPIAERYGVRAFSMGMVLALVLGLGGLLVPTFAEVANPLAITGIARAGQRPRRRAFMLALAGLLLVAVNLEFAGLGSLAGDLRALAVVASTQLAWKLWRGPGRGDSLAWALWLAGWRVTLGFVAAAVWPEQRVEAWHVAFVGGYALLDARDRHARRGLAWRTRPQRGARRAHDRGDRGAAARGARPRDRAHVRPGPHRGAPRARGGSGRARVRGLAAWGVAARAPHPDDARRGAAAALTRQARPNSPRPSSA